MKFSHPRYIKGFTYFFIIFSILILGENVYGMKRGSIPVFEPDGLSSNSDNYFQVRPKQPTKDDEALQEKEHLARLARLKELESESKKAKNPKSIGSN